jgi:hypothetical protein
MCRTDSGSIINNPACVAGFVFLPNARQAMVITDRCRTLTYNKRRSINQ